MTDRQLLNLLLNLHPGDTIELRITYPAYTLIKRLGTK